MSLPLALLIVFIAGAIGGVVNALLSENGFLIWKKERTKNRTIWRPGIAGNILISGIASCISWGLYGPFAASYIIGGPPTTENIGLTLSALVGAVLVGVSGARWLTNEVDKNLLKQAASAAAASQASETKAANIATATPFQAMRIAIKK